MPRTLTSVLLLTSAILMSPAVLAQSCEAAFKKSGNIVNGTQYSSSVRLPGLSKASAVAQVQNLAVTEKLDVINLDAEAGSILLEERATMAHKAIPLIVAITEEDGAGVVDLTVRTGRGAASTADAMKGYVCRLLGQIKPIKAPKVASVSNAPIKIAAVRLASQIQAEAKDSAAAVNPRHVGKRYQVNGWVAEVESNSTDVLMRFQKYNEGELVKHLLESMVVCVMAPSQKAYALALRDKDRVDLVGDFESYNSARREIILRDCKPAR